MSQKIIIQAYKDKRFDSSQGMPSFTIPINPEQFSQKFELKNDNSQGSGNQGTSSKYGLTLPEELKLDFILDNTNTVSGNTLQGTPVPRQVRQLLATVYDMNGKNHQTNVLRIGWSDQRIFGANKQTFEWPPEKP